MAMFLRTRRRVRPRVACRRGGAISAHSPRTAGSPTAKGKPRKDAGSVRIRRIRARPSTQRDAALQPPGEPAGRGEGVRRPLLGLLPAADGLLRPLARARVRLRPLPVDGKATSVAQAPVSADLHQPLDRLGALAAQIALDLKSAVDVTLELRDLLVGQVTYLGVGREAELGAHLLGGRLADPVDVREPDLEPLLIGKVDSGDSCQISSPSPVVACVADSCR